MHISGFYYLYKGWPCTQQTALMNQTGLLEGFREFIEQHALLVRGQSVLLAVSGGVDSMVMAWLFKQSSFPLAMAHGHFSLRGEEAAKDQALVEQTARLYQVPFHTKSFDTMGYARRHKLSVQMAARNLRYDWLESLRREHGFDRIATAHHLDDAVETLLINLGRGTGIAGLKGIPVINKQVIRPLLFTGREEIAALAEQEGITFREDLSNREMHYSRNLVRHRSMPVLRQLNPGLSRTMKQFFDHMEDTHALYQFAVEQHKRLCIRKQGSETEILLEPLLRSPGAGSLLYEFLKEFGFRSGVCNDLFEQLGKQAGRVFYSDSHVALRDRDKLIVFPHVSQPEQSIWYIEPHTRMVDAGGVFFRFDRYERDPAADNDIPRDPTTIVMDEEALDFPLILRRWKAGDRFQPLGMRGQKKVSDLLTDKKIPLHRKKQTWVLISGDRIVWVAGLRTDEDHRITPGTRRVFLARIY